MALDTKRTTSTTDRIVTDITRQLVNRNSAGQGSVLPGRLAGSTQVPVVSNLRVTPLGDSFLGTDFTITWEDLPRSVGVDRYNVYARRVNDTEEPKIIASVNQSPCRIQVGGDSTSPVVFWVQTQLKNGFASPRTLSPTVTGIATQAQIDDDDITSVSISKLLADTALFTSTAIFKNGNYELRLSSSDVRITDGTRSVIVSGSNISLAQGSRSINIDSDSIDLTDGTATVSITAAGNISLARSGNSVTVTGSEIILTDGTAFVSVNASGNVVLSRGGNSVTVGSSSIVLTDGTRSVTITVGGIDIAQSTAHTVISSSGVQIYGGTSGVGIGASTFASSPVQISSSAVRFASGFGDSQFTNDYLEFFTDAGGFTTQFSAKGSITKIASTTIADFRSGGISLASSGNVIKLDNAGAYVSIGGNKVLGARQSAISNPASTTADNNAAIISILGAMRTHGLIAT